MAEEVHDGASLRAALAEIASDFSFSWTPGARQLFADLAPERFAELGHNPTALLSELTDDDLARALTPEYALRLGRVQERLEARGRARHLVAGAARRRTTSSSPTSRPSSASTRACRSTPAASASSPATT